ncbi:MAG: HD domain-containing protein [Bdellovibrionota bacterium]
MRFPIPIQRTELMHLLAKSPRLKHVYQALLERESDGDSAHDQAHLLRVGLWTARILSDENQVESAIAAALLHDLVNVHKNHPDRAKASQFSAEAAAPILTEAGFGNVDEITTAIRQHSFSRGEKPESALGKALQDADRLEALGSIGIMRTYSTGVRMGTRYFHPDDPWAHNRPLDDSAFSLDHFFIKLLRLPDTMNTAAGREEALQRLKPMQAFIQSLERELGESR